MTNTNTFFTNDFTKAFVDKFQINDFSDFNTKGTLFDIRDIKDKFSNTIAKIQKDFNFTFDKDDCVQIFSTSQDFLIKKIANHIDLTGQSDDISRFMFAFIIDKQDIVNDMVDNLIKTHNNKNDIVKFFFDKDNNVVVQFDI